MNVVLPSVVTVNLTYIINNDRLIDYNIVGIHGTVFTILLQSKHTILNPI